MSFQDTIQLVLTKAKVTLMIIVGGITKAAVHLVHVADSNTIVLIAIKRVMDCLVAGN